MKKEKIQAIRLLKKTTVKTSPSIFLFTMWYCVGLFLFGMNLAQKNFFSSAVFGTIIIAGFPFFLYLVSAGINILNFFAWCEKNEAGAKP